MTRSISRHTLSLALIVCTTATAVPVVALEEVVVTARKRDESIMKVPVTTTVLSEEMLDNYAIDDVKGIADKTPGLNFSTGPLASGVLVSMRGVGTGTNNPGIDQSIALVADGMQLTQGLAFQAATFDVAQVEVMKGPQALFFGKAAPAGVIAVRTADPTEEAELRVRLGYEFEAEEQVGEVIASGPVTDTLGLRLAVQSSQMDGYFKNNAEPQNVTGAGPLGALAPLLGDMGAAPVTHADIPEKETLLIRGTALWQPIDAFKARLKLNYSDSDTQGYGGEPQLVSCPEGIASTAPLSLVGASALSGDNCKADDKLNFVYMDPAAFPGVYNNGVPFNKAEQAFGVLELSYDLNSELTLTSVTGYYDVDQSSLINGSITSGIGSPFAIQSDLQRHDFTQELRLTSNSADPVNFMLGVFYQKGETDHLSSLPANQSYNTLLGAIAPEDILPPVLAWADHNLASESFSVFGQVLWDITADLELGLGVRWSDEEREHKLVNRAFEQFPAEFAAWGSALGLPPGFLPTVAVPVPLAKPKIDSSTWSPELSLAYTLSDDLTLYGNLKQAYKSGSFDIAGRISDGDDTSFDDERIRGGEIGIKARQLDGSLTINAAAYYYKYKDMQVETRVFNPAEGVVAVRTVNAASSDIYGIDLDASYAVAQLPGLIVYGALNWNISEYDDFDYAQCWTGQTTAQGCNIDRLDASDPDNIVSGQDGVGDGQDLSGEPLLRAPEWMANIGIDYQTPVFGDLTLRVGSDVSYSSSYSASSTNIDGYQKDYSKTSASIGLIGADERWSLELIGDNLTDEYVYGNCAPSSYADTLLFGQGQSIAGTGTSTGGPGGQPENACWVERGRSLLLRFTMNIL